MAGRRPVGDRRDPQINLNSGRRCSLDGMTEGRALALRVRDELTGWAQSVTLARDDIAAVGMGGAAFTRAVRQLSLPPGYAWRVTTRGDTVTFRLADTREIDGQEEIPF